MTTSMHYTVDRAQREALIAQIGEGAIIATFTVDKGHPNGPELHSITDTGIIIIRNKRTKKLVTKLIARPGQIKRYFKNRTPKVRELLKLAEEHKTLGFNLA